MIMLKIFNLFIQDYHHDYHDHHDHHDYHHDHHDHYDRSPGSSTGTGKNILFVPLENFQFMTKHSTSLFKSTSKFCHQEYLQVSDHHLTMEGSGASVLSMVSDSGQDLPNQMMRKMAIQNMAHETLFNIGKMSEVTPQATGE